ncbi:hypothetical protein QNI19_14960 [Cytophagaceae bacterium DM2B3-1]|uniref:Uncharacterized protein n=1 Tax=Xanthocytophaga flava TaxID=3048013 RepID=A0ABT7CMN2_9BACT|nr:hypothetical protein [Xanthocytophaga flavus]MDJ1469731.1 hypothetical protein [Xanthocytophaga flavus]MDJ1494242.1 hypothetical protein [Xanthocytophaga flavus]
MAISNDVIQDAKQLQKQFKLTDFEALSLAIQAERNLILERGLLVSPDNSYPTGLEAIAIALGYTR